LSAQSCHPFVANLKASLCRPSLPAILAGLCQRISIFYQHAEALLTLCNFQIANLSAFAGLASLLMPAFIRICWPFFFCFFRPTFAYSAGLCQCIRGGFCWPCQLTIVPAFANLSMSTFAGLCGHFLQAFADLCRPGRPVLMYTTAFAGLCHFNFGSLFQHNNCQPMPRFCGRFCQVSVAGLEPPCRPFPTQQTKAHSKALLAFSNPTLIASLCQNFADLADLCQNFVANL
jgi:hypothetical protein